MSRDTLKIATGVLAAIALVLAYLLFGSGAVPSRPQAPTPPATVGSPEGERLGVLPTPPQNASEEVKRRHSEAVQRAAQDADTLEITACTPNPLVLHLTENARFTARNNDAAPHTIQVNQDHQYAVPAQGEVSIEADFGFGPGIYGYGCDNSAQAVGVFFVTPAK